MLSFLLAVALSPVPQGPGSSTAPVVINEFSHDDSGGTDDKDFVELWNRTGAPVDISGWTLQGEEGTAGGVANGAFTFPPATTIAPGQYLVVGMSAVPNATLFVTATSPPEWLGENVAGSANAPDGVTLRDAGGAVIDAVVWNYAIWSAGPPPWLEGSGLWGAAQMIDANLAPEGLLTAQRREDGYDDDDNGRDFVYMRWTPGAPNGSNNTLLPVISENCDGGVLSTLNSLFAFSFTPLTLFDPAAVTVAIGTTRAFPPSPQGGNVARLQDPTGGGNMVTAQTILLGDFLLECYVHVVPGNPQLLSGEGESWSIGVRGTTDPFGHPHDASGSYYTQTALCATSRSPGATGVMWIAYVSAGQTDLWLVDANNGGPGLAVLAGPITATTGVNDGWQRLRLRVDGTNLVANFGGTYGADDGQRFTATVTPGSGTVWMQYRECIVANANMTGLLVDRVEMYLPFASSVSFAGTASPTNFGTPNIATAGTPQLGNPAFQITASGMIGGGIGLLALDLGPLLPGVPVPGAPSSVLLYAAPTFVAAVLNTPGGTTTFAFPVPPINSLAGSAVAAQWFDLDITLPAALPVGSSRGCQIILGN